MASAEMKATCPKCGESFAFAESDLGKNAKCPCGHKFPLRFPNVPAQAFKPQPEAGPSAFVQNRLGGGRIAVRTRYPWVRRYAASIRVIYGIVVVLGCLVCLMMLAGEAARTKVGESAPGGGSLMTMLIWIGGSFLVAIPIFATCDVMSAIADLADNSFKETA
jgi:DNA-directed RNA polymerase subunit RPC12/RpoP